MSPGGIQPVHRLKVADSVAAQLEQLIVAGEYAVGERLPAERALAEQFGVGRSSTREAMRIIEAAGLVRSDHGVGVFVVNNKRVTPGASELLLYGEFTVFHLFEARLCFEPYIAALAARRLTPAVAEELGRIIAEAGDPRIRDDEFVTLDARLHRTIAEAANNPVLLRLVDSVGPLFMTYSHRVIALPGRRSIAHAGHQKIVEAIVARKARQAGAAAARHIREVERDIAEQLDLAGASNGAAHAEDDGHTRGVNQSAHTAVYHDPPGRAGD